VPIGLAIDQSLDRIRFAQRIRFTAADVLEQLKEHDAPNLAQWFEEAPHAHIDELERLVASGILFHATITEYGWLRQLTESEADEKE